ncbi:hypothetical protein Ddc_10223 [Ditylenchus destructor]|nr:hypothetical protein Ddc_10223 [Ditylenchus destructor]
MSKRMSMAVTPSLSLVIYRTHENFFRKQPARSMPPLSFFLDTLSSSTCLPANRPWLWAKSCRLFVNNVYAQMNGICNASFILLPDTLFSTTCLPAHQSYHLDRELPCLLTVHKNPYTEFFPRRLFQMERMEWLENKLEVQRKISAFGVIFTVAVYFLFWYNTECWALPFQESPCKQTRDLPLLQTNHSTLAETVDEFTLALRTEIAKIRDTIEISHLAERQALSNATKKEILQLFSQHSPNLVAFTALKREDERLHEMENAIADGYWLIIPFLIISGIFLIIIRVQTKDCYLGTSNRTMTPSEIENSQTARLKHLKRRIPLLYFVTFTCIAIEVALFFMFVGGNYYGGSSTFFYRFNWNADDCSVAQYYKYKLKYDCTFTDYPSSGNKLETVLNRHVDKLNSFMSSPLETRQKVWLHEIDIIDAAIDKHLELKKYHVDRRTMPRKIGNVLPGAFFFICSLPFLFFWLVCFLLWAKESGSVWHAFKFFRIRLPELLPI